MTNNPTSGAAARVGGAPSSGSHFDIIVIGGGAIGLSAAYWATARGLGTLLLEQFDTLANPRAGSGGASRMFRVTHASAGMTKLAESALALWKDIEAASGTCILWTQPILFYG